MEKKSMYHKKEVYEKRFFSVLFYRETTINVGISFSSYKPFRLSLYLG